MTRRFRPILALVLAAALPLSAQAHRMWLFPGGTVLSGDDAWVTFDAAVSNDIFHTDHAPLSLRNLEVIAPDGRHIATENTHSGVYRSVFDLQLTKPGTYKVAVVSDGLNARWMEDGQRRSWPRRGVQATDEEFAAAVPADAADLVVTRSSRRIESFVTLGAPSKSALKPEGRGLELSPLTHPNDLFAGERGEFRLTIDGEAAVGAEVTVLAAGMRYRNSQDAIEVVADDDGLFSVVWPAAGMYWLEAVYSDDKATPPASARSGTYIATLEVFPQ